MIIKHKKKTVTEVQEVKGHFDFFAYDLQFLCNN